MKAKRFLAFVAGAAMLFGAVGCTPDEPIDDLTKASISVTPTQEAVTLAGGSATIEVTSNAAWSVETTSDVEITPTSGKGNGVVTITVPSSEVGRNIFVEFKARYEGSIAGDPYPTTANATVIVFQNEAGEKKYTTNVKAVRALLKAMTIPSANGKDQAAEVSDEVKALTLTAVVVGESDGNMGKNQLLAVQDNSTEPESGLTIYCDNAGDMQKGQVVEVSLATAKVGTYGKLIQLYTDNVNAIGEPIEVTAIPVTTADALKYESQYVKLNNLHPAPTAVGKTYGDSSFDKNVPFYDANYAEVIIRMSSYASFKDDVIPAMEGDICGVVSQWNGDLQFLPQYASDFDWKTDFDANPTTVTISQIEGVGYYKVENAWIAGFTGNGPIITDSSNAFIGVLVYSNKDYTTIGQKLTIVGPVNIHQGGLQFSESSEITKIDGEPVEVTYPTPVDYTAATAVEELAAKFGGEGAPYLAEYAEFSGVVNYDGTYYNFLFADVDANKIKGSLTKNPNEAVGLKELSGKAVKLRGFVTDYNKPYLSIVVTSAEIDTSLVSLSAENVALVAPAGIENGVTALAASGLKNEDITVTPDGTVVTSASIDVENGKLTYTVAANAGEAREGKVTLSVAGLNDVVVVFNQLGSDSVISTIAEVWAGAFGEYVLIGAQAVAVANNQVILADNSGKIIALYRPSVTPAVGDYVNVKGTSNQFNQLLQFSNATVVVTGHSDTLITPDVQNLTGKKVDELLANINASKDYMPQYIEYIGVLSVSGSYYNVEIPDATTAIGSLKTSAKVSADVIKSYANKPIKVKGYFCSISSSKYINTWIESIEDDTTIKMLDAQDIAGVSADGVVDATATIVAANLGAVTATCDGTIVTSASVEGNVLTYTVSANTTTEVREGSITLSAEGVESVTIKVSQLVADNSTYAMIDKIANLAAGDYYMAAYCESYNETDFEANPYHLCTGAKITTANSNADLYTTPYSYSDAGKLSPITGAEKFAKIVTLVAVEGKENTYYVMLDGKYVYSYATNTNRRISLTDTPTEWVASDHSKGGVVLSSNQVDLGSAAAQSDFIRSYKAGSSSIKYGLYFFKQN